MAEASAEGAGQQSPGWRPRSGRNPGCKRWEESPERATQRCAALSGLFLHPIRIPRVPEPAGAGSSTLGCAPPRLRRCTWPCCILRMTGTGLCHAALIPDIPWIVRHLIFIQHLQIFLLEGLFAMMLNLALYIHSYRLNLGLMYGKGAIAGLPRKFCVFRPESLRPA